MMSFTAFRSAFVASETSRARREEANKPWYSSTINVIERSKQRQRNDEETDHGLPRISSATLTGMRTFIHSGRHTWMSQQSTDLSSPFNGENEERLLYDGRHEQKRTRA